jgi:hypothetical protein
MRDRWGEGDKKENIITAADIQETEADLQGEMF